MEKQSGLYIAISYVSTENCRLPSSNLDYEETKDFKAKYVSNKSFLWTLATF